MRHKFPTKLNSYGLRYKRENSVFQNMVWVLKNSKCWENSLGIHLTFNYGQNHLYLMLQKSVLLKNVCFSGKTMYIVIKHPPLKLIKSSNRIRWEWTVNAQCECLRKGIPTTERARVLSGDLVKMRFWFSRSQVGAWDSAVFITSSTGHIWAART